MKNLYIVIEIYKKIIEKKKKKKRVEKKDTHKII